MADALVDAFEGGRNEAVNRQLQELNKTAQATKTIADTLHAQSNRSFMTLGFASIVGSGFASVIAVAAFVAWRDWIAEVMSTRSGG